MTVSRREWLRTVLQGIGIGMVVGPVGTAIATAQGSEAGHGTGPLTVRVTRPFDAETPVREFASWLTPNERFFTRSHFGPPSAETVQPDVWD